LILLAGKDSRENDLRTAPNPFDELPISPTQTFHFDSVKTGFECQQVAVSYLIALH
jgi:hypothetical protein